MRWLPLPFVLLIFVSSCAKNKAPEVSISTKTGRHSLPFRPNQDFILAEVQRTSSLPYEPNAVSDLVYYFYGKKRKLTVTKVGDSDGTITYLGPRYENEIPGMESPIMDERVIQLSSGEEITIDGNTVDPGGIRLRPIPKAS